MSSKRKDLFDDESSQESGTKAKRSKISSDTSDGDETDEFEGDLPKVRHGSRCSSPHLVKPVIKSRSVFFKLPLELRNHIYKLTLLDIRNIHVFYDYLSSNFLFGICKAQDDEGCPSSCSVIPSNRDFVDTAILATCRAIATEVISLMAATVSFYFDSLEDVLDFLAKHEFFERMRSISSRMEVNDDMIRPAQQAQISTLVEKLSSLQSLTIYGSLHTTLPMGLGCFEDGFLNVFRAMSRIPLTTASVLLRPLGVTTISQQKIKPLQARACELLLRDHTLPPLPQVPYSKAVVDLIKTHAEKKRREQVSWTPGRVPYTGMQ